MGRPGRRRRGPTVAPGPARRPSPVAWRVAPTPDGDVPRGDVVPRWTLVREDPDLGEDVGGYRLLVHADADGATLAFTDFGGWRQWVWQLDASGAAVAPPRYLTTLYYLPARWLRSDPSGALALVWSTGDAHGSVPLCGP